ncbi:MAG: Gfo/Idh/MocA family protein [Planctomycetota bacterium]|jgi:predicted dehydrogenase
MNRREFIKKSSSSIISTAFVGSLASNSFARDNLSEQKVRIGVIGTGGRGRWLMKVLLNVPGVEMSALCDINEANLGLAVNIVKKAAGLKPVEFSKGPYDYKRMLERDDLDAVLIATPIKWHAEMATDALNAGKDVGCEVTAGNDLTKLHKLVEAKEKSGRHYMLFENYIYTRNSMMIYNMVQKGVFGNPYYAECSYIHDCKNLRFNSDGTLTWCGESARDCYGNSYATHSLGPVSKWFGLNDGDRMEYLTTIMSKPQMMHEYAVKKFGADSPQAKIKFKSGDYTTTLIYTAKGRVIRVDLDTNSTRPLSNFHLIQGTKAVYDSRGSIIHIDGVSPPHQWEKADKYRDKYDHKYWRKLGAAAAQTGHGGGDYFVMHDFVRMIKEDTEPWIDVYDAACWSVIYHCSHLSIDGKSKPVAIPDFTNGRWNNPNWRQNNLKPILI